MLLLAPAPGPSGCQPGQPGSQPAGQPGKASQPGWPGGPAGLVWDRFGARKVIIHQIQAQSRPISNRVSCKVTRKGEKWSRNVPQRVRTECVSTGLRVKWIKLLFLETFCKFGSSFGRKICVRDAFLSISFVKVKILCKYRPNFSRSRLSIGNSCKSRRRFTDGW